MKKTVLVSVFLPLILLISPAVLRGEIPVENPSSETEVKGTAYDQNALTVLPGAPKVSSVRGTSGSQALAVRVGGRQMLHQFQQAAHRNRR